MYQKHQRDDKRAGFSLIILALILAAASIIIIVTLPSDSDKLAANIKTTNFKLQKITDALKIYYDLNNKLPCPSSFTIPQGTANFGSANCTCGGGIICPSTSGLGNLVVGSIPVKNLGLREDYMFDEWGHRITYAMDSTASANVLTVKDLNGNLDVDAKGNQPIAFYFSHGPQGKGAYLINGTLNSASCTGAAAGEDTTRSEIENCDATVAATADRNFIRSNWNSSGGQIFTHLTGEIYKKAIIGFKDNGAKWLLFQMERNGTLTTLASAVSGGANNIWTLVFGTTVDMGPISCNLADNGKTICVIVGAKYTNSIFSGCGILGCATYWAFTAKPDVGFISNTNAGGFNAGGAFSNFTNTLFGSKPQVKCWKAAPTRFLCMAVSDSYYKVFSMDTETGVKDISTAAPTINGAFSGYNFWGTVIASDTAGFDCAPSGNAAGDFICMAAGQGGSFMSFKLNETTGITNKSGIGCYGAYGFLGAITLTTPALACVDQVYGGQARDVSCNMIKNSTTQAACVAVYNKTLSGRAARLFIATANATTPTYCPAAPLTTTNTCLVTPAASAGDNLKAQDGTTQFTSSNMGDVLGFNCMPNANKFTCFIGGAGIGATASGYIGIYNFTPSVFTTTAMQSMQPGGGVYMNACGPLDDQKYYCLYSGTGSGSGCTAGTNNCNYSVWKNYQTRLNSGTYTAWPVDTSWTNYSIAK